MTTPRAVALGALTVAALEAAETTAFWWLYRGVTPARIFRFIASGLFGPAAYSGGTGFVWIGVGLHLFNAAIIVAVYVFACRLWPVLVRHPAACGFAYGAAVNLFLEFIVVPLSAVPQHASGVRPLLLLHSLLSQGATVGVPAALFARASVAPLQSGHAQFT